MQLDINNLTYVIFRLLPIILPSFFVIGSIFGQDIKAFIYLAGLLFACFLCTLVGNALPISTDAVPNAVCNYVTLGNTEQFSKVPLSGCVYGYTYAYLLYIIITYNKSDNLVMNNLATIIFFPCIIIIDCLWNLHYNCSNIMQYLAGIFVAGGVGCLWAYIIDKSKAVKLQYFNGLSSASVCSVPNQSTFKCTKN